MSTSFIPGVVTGGIGSTTITLAVVVYFLKNPEKFLKWVSIITGFLSRIWSGLEYISTKTMIEGKVNSYVLRLGESTYATFPMVGIQWARPGQKQEIIWEDNQAIIIMRDRKYRNRNFVSAAHFFTSEMLLREAKRHLSPSQSLSLDLFTTKQILEEEHRPSLPQFMTDYFDPLTERSSDSMQIIRQFVPISRRGIYFPILIQELTYLGNKVFVTRPRQDIIKEVKDLIAFLERFANSDSWPNHRDFFVGNYMRCAIHIVASKEVRDRGKVEGHFQNIAINIRQGLEDFYLIGKAESDNRAFVDRVADKVVQEFQDVEVVKTTQFRNKIKVSGKYVEVDTYLVHLRNPRVINYVFEEEPGDMVSPAIRAASDTFGSKSDQLRKG